MKPKKVAIVAEWLTSRGGAENVIFELAQTFPKADIFTTVINKKLFPEFKNRKVTSTFLQNIPFINKKHQLALPLLPRAIASIDLSGYDLIISSSSAFGKGIEKPNTSYHICYCHTPMRWVWEPERDNRLSKLPFKNYIIKILKKWDLKSNKGVDLFIANSHNTASKIKLYYKQDAKVVYPPIDTNYLIKNTRLSKKDDYYFAISRLIPYKRIDLAIKACSKLNKRLIIAGTGPEESYLKSISSKNVVFLGHIDQKDKIKYYKGAKATIFCADEDFGIVPVESLACGTPVIAYKKGGVLEIIDDEVNGILFEEQTIESLAKAIEKFERTDFSQKTLQQSSSKFDKMNFRREILTTIEKIRR